MVLDGTWPLLKKPSTIMLGANPNRLHKLEKYLYYHIHYDIVNFIGIICLERLLTINYMIVIR